MTMRSVLQASENGSADPVGEVVPSGSEGEIQTPHSENIPELEAIPAIVSPPYSVEDADPTNNFKRLLIRDRYGTSGAQRYIAEIMDKDHSPVIPSTATDTDKLLIASARSGNIEMMEMMLKLEPNINADLAGEGTALTAAVKSGKLEAVELLLNAGADVNVASSDGSALKKAVLFKSMPMVKSLLQRGADPNLEERGTTAFALAGTIGDTEIIREMLRKGADINLRSGHELRPLSAAAQYGHTSAVKLLLDNGAEVTESTIFYVVQTNKTKVLELFLDLDMNMKIYEGHGSSPLIWAAVSGELAMVKMLLRRPEIDVEHINHKNTSEGMTALGYAAKRGDNAIVKALLDAHADVNISNDLKHDPLKTAVYFGRFDTVKLLLGVPGVDFRTPGHRGATALQEAAARGHEKIVRLLLDKGADPNARSGDESVLMSAVKSGKTSVVMMLMAAGARS